MDMAIAVPRYTVDDLDRFPNDGNRYELLDGVLLVTPSPALSHQLIANRIQSCLAEAVQWPGHAHVVGPGVVVRLPNTQLQPDMDGQECGNLPRTRSWGRRPRNYPLARTDARLDRLNLAR